MGVALRRGGGRGRAIKKKKTFKKLFFLKASLMIKKIFFLWPIIIVNLCEEGGRKGLVGKEFHIWE